MNDKVSRRISYKMPDYQIYGMYNPSLDAFRELSADVMQTKNGMTAEEMRSTLDEIYAAADIYYTPEAAEDYMSLYAVENGVARIPVKGMLVQSVHPCAALFGEASTEYGFIRAAMQQAESDFTVSAIQLDVSSPGGEVDGVDETAAVIAQASKPTTAVIEGMAASAAYWLASQTDKIIARSKTDLIGSIGVAAEIRDYSKRDEKSGVKRYVLTSTDAPNKRVDINTEEGRSQIVARLDDVHNIFVERVAMGRGTTPEDVTENYGRGDVLIAPKALAAGMIDDVQDYTKKEKNGQNASLMRPEKNTLQREAQMENEQLTLSEFLEKSPEAKAEYEASLKTAGDEAVKTAVEAERTRISELLDIGANVSEPIMKAIKGGMFAKDYAYDEAKRAKAKNAATGAQNLGSFNPDPQTPADTAPPKAQEQKTALELEIERQAKMNGGNQ